MGGGRWAVGGDGVWVVGGGWWVAPSTVVAAVPSSEAADVEDGGGSCAIAALSASMLPSPAGGGMRVVPVVEVPVGSAAAAASGLSSASVISLLVVVPMVDPYNTPNLGAVRVHSPSLYAFTGSAPSARLPCAMSCTHIAIDDSVPRAGLSNGLASGVYTVPSIFRRDARMRDARAVAAQDWVDTLRRPPPPPVCSTRPLAAPLTMPPKKGKKKEAEDEGDKKVRIAIISKEKVQHALT